MTIAERIIEIVKDHGGNMSAFARRINVTPAYISKIGKTPDLIPSERTISDICREYHVSRIWLETGEGEKYVFSRRQQIDQIARAKTDGLDEEKVEAIELIVQQMENMSESNLALLLEIAKRMSDQI